MACQFVVALPLDIGFRHRTRPFGIQLLHAGGDPPSFVAEDRMRLRVVARVGHVARLVDLTGIGAACPHPVDGVVAGNRRKPPHRARPRRRVAVRTLPDLDVDLLQRLLRLGSVTKDTQAHAEEFRVSLVEEPAKGRPVAERDAADQFLDPVQPISPLRPRCDP